MAHEALFPAAGMKIAIIFTSSSGC